MSAKNHIGDGMSPESAEVLHKYNASLSLRSLADLLAEPGRFDRFSFGIDGLLLDISRVHLDADALAGLLDMAAQCGLPERRDVLFAGGNVNLTENRPALHMALRTPEVLEAAGGEESLRVRSAMQRMLEWAAQLYAGRSPFEDARVIRHIVHVGIGGSLLGTRLVCEALDEGGAGVQVHFLGSVDATARERLVRSLDPAETLVVLVSKSFTTGDTLLHGRRLRDWLRAALGDEDAERHMVAVTSQVDRARSFGIDPSRMLYFSDWVGDRYSLWTPVSLATAALIGPPRFEELLNGAAIMDRHFRTAALARNLPVIYGLVGVWNRNFQGHPAWGVMPYDSRLRLLPAWLQQLVMESNGKSVTQSGAPCSLATAPVVWGETGTEAQHSVFQALHQGSDIVPLNFVGVLRPPHGDREAQDELLANLLAQATALALGRSEEATRAELGDIGDKLLLQRSFAGNRPSELILLDELDPQTLGMLLALYEHKVFVESVIWGINAFDQWGVELGKTLAPGIQTALGGADSGEPSLAPLLAYIGRHR